MDVELEEVAKLLFPDEIPDLWKDNDEFSKYMVHLSSCGVEKLGKEGAHLREERLAILDQTRDLAYTNYKTFIHTADCSRTIFKDFTSVETHLEGLSCCLPNLRESVEQFLATSRNLSQSRHLTSLTLTKHTQLLEVLELPQLMDTCVRNGYYDEALEILAYVRRLERKHTDIHIIAGIVKEVQSGTRLMLNQLLAQLRSPLALPQCLKVIGLLRRLDVFTEPELRLKFLQARDAWFTGILKAIPKDDPYQHIIKVVEASRVHLFDIVTQYRAIFSDDDTRFSLGDPEVNEQAIFHGWILHKVNNFINIVEKDLERGVGCNLESVLAQCMFFGQSFSRIGADFRNLLIPLFQNAALVQCEKDVRVANIRFDETLSSFSLMEAPQMSASSTYIPETQDRTRPPLTLMEFLPLAHYMNGLVAAFNTLRQCCPVSSLPAVIRLLEQSLTKVIGALLELHRLESSGFTAREEASFQRLCSVVAEGVLPHVNSCLRLLYPLQQISVITGEPVAKLQRENFGQLDLDELLEPIKSLLPKKEDNLLAASEVLHQDMVGREIKGLQENTSLEELSSGIQKINLANYDEPKQDTFASGLLNETTSVPETFGDMLTDTASSTLGQISQAVPENDGGQLTATSLTEDQTSEALIENVLSTETASSTGGQVPSALPENVDLSTEISSSTGGQVPSAIPENVDTKTENSSTGGQVPSAIPENVDMKTENSSTGGQVPSAIPENVDMKTENSSTGGQVPSAIPENVDMKTENSSSTGGQVPSAIPENVGDILKDTASSAEGQVPQEDYMVSGKQQVDVDDTIIPLDKNQSQNEVTIQTQQPALTLANQASIPKFHLGEESNPDEALSEQQESKEMSEIPL